MLVDRHAAAALLVDIGLPTATMWVDDPNKLADRLNRLGDYADDKTRCRDKKNQRLMEQIFAHLKAGGKVGVEGATPPAPKSAGKVGGKVGVIASIVEFLHSASRKNPISKGKIVRLLAERFPDKDADGMKKTVSVQLSSGLRTQKGLDVRRSDSGYWIEE